MTFVVGTARQAGWYGLLIQLPESSNAFKRTCLSYAIP